MKGLPHIIVEIPTGGKRLVSRPSPESISVYFSGAPASLPASLLTIVVSW